MGRFLNLHFCIFKQVYPQGTIAEPLLFLIYINSLMISPFLLQSSFFKQVLLWKHLGKDQGGNFDIQEPLQKLVYYLNWRKPHLERSNINNS